MIEIILLSLGTACLSLFLDMCMESGMILNGYYRMISKLEYKYVWLFKPLGGCLYCMATWIYIIISLLVFYKSGVIFDFIGFILGIGFNYIFIKLGDKYVV